MEAMVTICGLGEDVEYEVAAEIRLYPRDGQTGHSAVDLDITEVVLLEHDGPRCKRTALDVAAFRKVAGDRAMREIEGQLIEQAEDIAADGPDPDAGRDDRG